MMALAFAVQDRVLCQDHGTVYVCAETWLDNRRTYAVALPGPGPLVPGLQFQGLGLLHITMTRYSDTTVVI